MLLKFVSSLDALDLYGQAVGIQFLPGAGGRARWAGDPVPERPERLLPAPGELRPGSGIAAEVAKRASSGRVSLGPRPRNGGIGLLLAAHWVQSIQFHVISAVEVGEIVEVLLIGMGAAYALGVVAGLAVAVADPGIGVSTKRLVVTRGLIAAGACVVAGIVGSAIYGGLFGPASSDLPTAPGLPRAAFHGGGLRSVRQPDNRRSRVRARSRSRPHAPRGQKSPQGIRRSECGCSRSAEIHPSTRPQKLARQVNPRHVPQFRCCPFSAASSFIDALRHISRTLTLRSRSARPS